VLVVGFSLAASQSSLITVAEGAQLSSGSASSDPSGWSVYNGGVTQDHYFPQTQINRHNVKNLKLAWSYEVGEIGWLETNPLIADGIVYGTTAKEKILALDAGSGHLLWKFDSGIDGQQPIRGLSLWKHGTESRLFVGIMNYLYALDPKTGKPIESFAENGRIDLRKELGEGEYQNQSIVLTSPGIVYRDMIIVGGRNPETPPAPPGDIRAFDVHTGKLLWRFRTIPHPGEPGYQTWPKDAWQTAGAANNWAGMSLDEKHGIVYVPTGSAVPDFYGGNRVGDDLFADTLLALDASTGKLLWHFQGVHHDLWDRDFPAPPALVTVKRDGRMVDAVAQTTKQGVLFLLDRTNGKPLFPVEERPVPPSDVPGEVASPTQPVPSAPAPYARQFLNEDLLTNRTPEAHAWALKEYRTFRNGGMFTPLTVGKQTLVVPGFDGGAEWGGPAVDPVSGIIYVNTNDIAATGGLTPADPHAGLGAKTYQDQCAVCHGQTRAGSPPDFPSLLNIQDRLTAAQITNLIHQGRGRMPSFPSLTDSTLDALLAYLRSGNDAKPAAEEKKELGHDKPAESSHVAKSDVYQSNCAMCHGINLKGNPPSFPSLIGVGQRRTSEEITELVRHGRNAMPAFTTAQLSDADLQSVLRYLHTDSIPVSSPASAEPEERFTFTGYRKFYDPEGYPAVAPPWGTLSAIDLNTGKYLWKLPLGEYPELSSRGVPATGTENYGGPIVTGGGLVCIGATIFDRKFRCFDSKTGELLWQTELPYAGLATPSTYMYHGRQFIVIAAGGGRNPKERKGSAYIAFALP
jgi:glucose dehydrogenase